MLFVLQIIYLFLQILLKPIFVVTCKSPNYKVLQNLPKLPYYSHCYWYPRDFFITQELAICTHTSGVSWLSVMAIGYSKTSSQNTDFLGHVLYALRMTRELKFYSPGTDFPRPWHPELPSLTSLYALGLESNTLQADAVIKSSLLTCKF